ncbi:MAG TPA: hypothetical protein DIW41_03060, partial [Lachnospiraceae bacterium]|nr:hypothetical protein [Lachnospiraceae bacterium]
MKFKKSLIIVTVLIIILAVIAVIHKNKDASGEIYAVPASNTVVYDTSYREYLEQNGYNGIIEDAEINVDLINYTVADAMSAKVTDLGVATGDSGSITWTFDVPKEGFYN